MERSFEQVKKLSGNVIKYLPNTDSTVRYLVTSGAVVSAITGSEMLRKKKGFQKKITVWSILRNLSLTFTGVWIGEEIGNYLKVIETVKPEKKAELSLEE